MTKSAHPLHSAPLQQNGSANMKQATAIPMPDHALAVASLDPVIAMGFELRDLYRQYDRFDEAQSAARKAEKYAAEIQAKLGYDDTWDAIQARVKLLSTLEARTIPGALVQLSILIGQIDISSSSVIDEQQQERDWRSMKRLAKSVAAVLRVHGGDIDPLGKLYRGEASDAA